MAVLRTVVMAAGIFFIVLLALSFTSLPYRLYHSLGTKLTTKITQPPDLIVLLGAGGMPGGESLIRIHYTLILAGRYPQSRIVVALPADTVSFEKSDHYRIVSELINSGIDSSRIISETKGTNTYEQVIQIDSLIQQHDNQIVIVTSPEHMYRAIRCFRKRGFSWVNGLPAFENAFEEQLLIHTRGKKKSAKTLNENLDLRYNMWSYLQYEIKVLREYTAIIYYKLRGRI